MTSQAYVSALKRIDKLMDSDPDPSTKEGQELLDLVKQVEEHESHFYPIVRVLPHLLSVARI